jgi:predicted secreted protein with PEFG-CTERM motif
MAVALMSVTSVNQDVFAVDAGMSLTATAEDGSNTISFTGTTTANTQYVSFVAVSPNGQNVVSVDQVTPDANGEFSTEFNVSNWKQDGMYKITASHGQSNLYTITLNVEVTGGATAETSTSDSSIVTNQSNADLSDPYTTGSDEDARGLTIAANAMEGSDTIEITGVTSKTFEDVVFTVTAPNGNLVSVDQVSPDSSGDFATDISVGGPLWSQDGAYTVTAQQGSGNSNFIDSVEVDIADGLVVPEFGTIAAMILAVAIISIIAISAKSRLSIVPRY